jgi:hypothetical protein
VDRMITNDSVILVTQDTGAGPAPSQVTETDLDRAATKLLQANEDLRQHLDSYDYILLDGLEKYRAGMRISDVVRTMPTADATIGSEVEVIEVFEARRKFRMNLVAVLLDDGMSVNEIASIFNVTIESICDFANELGVPLD